MEKNVKSEIFSNFMFLKLEPNFRKMISNEKIAAKQEFENMIASLQDKFFIRTYMTCPRTDSDILIWRMMDNFEKLTENCARTFSYGIGKYLESTYSYTCVIKIREGMEGGESDTDVILKNKFGKYKYMLVHPISKSRIWYDLSEEERQTLINERSKVISQYPEITENFFASSGLCDTEVIVARESSSIETLIKVTKELKKQKIKNFTLNDKPNFLCIGKDLSIILDMIS